MHKTIVIVLALVASGCSGDPTRACLSTQQGQSRCTERIVETCDGKNWSTTSDCGAQGLVCHSSPTVECTAPVEPGGSCGSSSECSEGYDCPIASGLGYGICLDTCRVGAAVPDCMTSGQVCTSISGAFGLCVPPSTDGGLCYDDRECPTSAPQCHWFRTEELGSYVAAAGSCATGCAYNEINKGQGSCPAGLTCLESPFRIEYQGGSHVVYCDPAHAGTCDAASGYQCTTVTFGVSACTRPAAVCGHVLPMYGAPPDITAPSFDSTTQCGAGKSVTESDYRNFCGVTDPSASARPYCMSLYRGDLYMGVCVSRCTSAGECGPGYTCSAPTLDPATPVDPVFLENEVGTDGHSIACPDTACGAGYTCHAVKVNSGATYFCARPTTMCTKL